MNTSRQSHFEDFSTAQKHKKILLAHSGGVDSCVLGHLLISHKLSFAVAHCNFQLRAKASNEDALFVEDWCKNYKVPFFTVKFATKEYHQKNTQIAARELRYEWFTHLIDIFEFDIVVTAHHLNDQLETFLMHTIRGTGLEGLVGISETETLKRPLLSWTKDEILSYAESHSLKWREDETNASTIYFRNVLRHRVIPPLLEAVPQGLQNFSTTLKHLQAGKSLINFTLHELKTGIFIQEKEGIRIDLKALESLPELSFCLHHWMSPYGFEVVEVLKLLQSNSGKKCLTATHQLMRERTHLYLTELQPIEEERIWIDFDQKKITDPLSLSWQSIEKMPERILKLNEAVLDQEKLIQPIFLRKYKKGDYFYPVGMKGKKLLSKFFKDEKYTQIEKKNQWLLCTDKDLVWVVGKRCDRRFAATQNSKQILIINLF